MRIASLSASAVLMSLAGCGGGGNEAMSSGKEPDRGNAVEAELTAAELNSRLAGLNEAQRNAAFIRAIRDSDRPCQHVERSAARPPIRGVPGWTAWCERGTEWIILVRDGRRLQVTHAEELRRSGIDPGPSEQDAQALP